MPDSPLVQELLEEIVESHLTPEEVCCHCPELLAEVRARWTQICHLREEFDVMFPQFQSAAASSGLGGVSLPDVEGYEVESVLGMGGMGIVFRARHLSLNRIVALKMTLGGAYTAPHERERFRREAKAVAALVHPNIVQIYDVGESDGRPYFTMEFVDGGNLAQKLTGAPWPPREAAALVSTLAGAIHMAHINGIVHRDIKPANVLIAADGSPKIGDFGLAWHLSDESVFTWPGTALGTPSYMAPEQAAGTRHANEPAVDVYAIGAILYELLTGRPPFQAGTAAETIEQVIANDPVPPSRLNSKVPRDPEIICLKCLDKEPRLRYIHTADVKKDLDRFLGGEAISARPERWLDRRVRQARRRPVLSTLLAVGILLVSFTTVALAWLHAESAARNRQFANERTASLHSANALLDSMVEAMNRRAWSEARVLLNRAEAALDNHHEPETQSRVDQGHRDLELVDHLNAIRLNASSSVAGVLSFAKADTEYEEAFLSAGFGGMNEKPDIVAVRVRESNIRSALLAALDHWSECTPDQSRQVWVSSTARHADGDVTGWREKARTREVWNDEASLIGLIQTIPAPAEQCVPLLLAIEKKVDVDTSLRLTLLKRLHEVQPLDFWVNLRLGEVMLADERKDEAIQYYRTALAIQPGVGMVHNNLALALQRAGRGTEALQEFQRSISADPLAAAPHLNLVTTMWKLGRHDDAMALLPAAVRLNPNAAILHTVRARYHESQKRDSEALTEHQLAVTVQPKNLAAQRELRTFLISRGRSEEAWDAWRKALNQDPDEHDAWYGYAEYTLFLGKEEEYGLARQALLAKFGGTTNPYIAERTSRAVLLRPGFGEELSQAVALADRAVRADGSRNQGAYPAFLFARGLAAFRQGKFIQAIESMGGDASRVLGPVPRLVTAMALHRGGQTAEAKNNLAKAVSNYNWRASAIQDQDGWIIHVIRREAEDMILPDLNECRSGNSQPRDNSERLVLIASYQFSERFHEAAKLYREALALDQSLENDLGSRYRFNAACMAALAGSGVGVADKNLADAEKKRWRMQARQWLHDDLISFEKLLDVDSKQSHDWVYETLKYWRRTSTLIGIRDPDKLAILPPEEREECLALWREVDAMLVRTDGKK